MHTKISPYLLIFFLPLAFVVLLAGGLSLASFYNMQQNYQEVRAQQEKGIERLAKITQFNEDIAGIQRRVAETLEQAQQGKLDEGGVYQVHSRVVNELDNLAQRLPSLQDAGGKDSEDVRETIIHFQEYSNLIIQATDLAAIDPPMAMRQAYQAANSYLGLSEHSHAIAKSLIDQSILSSEVQEKSQADHARQNLWIGGMLVLLLMGIGFVLLQKLAYRLSALSATLENLAKGEINPESLPIVSALADEKRSLLRDLALAALTFRETSIAHRTAQYDLGKRMKELSCLLDVLRITQRDDFDIELILETVAARLAAAMRFPEIAAGYIECGARHFGVVGQGQELSADFVGLDGEPSRVVVVYCDALPADIGTPFLDEEQILLDGIASYLAGAIERRRILAQERDRQAMLDAVISGAPDAIELTEADSQRFVEVNEACCRILAYSCEELLGMTLFDIQATMPAEVQGEISRNIVETGGAQFETLHRRKDGSLINVWVNIRKIRQNNRDYLVRIWRDITAEKSAASEIRKLSLVVEQSPNPVVITDTSGHIEYVNDAFVSNTGYAREEVIGRNPRLLKSGKTSPQTYQEMRQAISSGRTWQGEFIRALL